MKDVKVLGPGCKRCNTTAEMVQSEADKLDIPVTIEKVTDYAAIAGHRRKGSACRRPAETRRPRSVAVGLNFSPPPVDGVVYSDAGAPGCLRGWARAKASFAISVSTMRLTVGKGVMSHLKYAAPAAWPARQMSASVI